MKNIALRVLFCLGVALCGHARLNAQEVVLTINWSNLSAVTFTATGNASAINYSDGYSYSEGIALRDFFTSPRTVNDFVDSLVSSSLTDSANNATAGTLFNELSAWNDDHEEYWEGYGVEGSGDGSDLTLWNNGDNLGNMTFSTSGQAFHGVATFNLTGYSGYTGFFPALNSTGTVRIWTDNGGSGNSVIGTWQVVGAGAVPEPSTYAVIGGVVALMGTLFLRRRRSPGSNA